VDIEFAVGEGQGEHGFLYGIVRRIALGEDRPWNHRAVEVLGCCLGPACPQESLIRVWAIELDAVERDSCALELAGFEEQRSEYEVRLVPNRSRLAVTRADSARPIELLGRRGRLAFFQECNAQVVVSEPVKRLRAL
jgi:hypothetical protein